MVTAMQVGLVGAGGGGVCGLLAFSPGSRVDVLARVAQRCPVPPTLGGGPSPTTAKALGCA